jgi:intracellular septation protein
MSETKTAKPHASWLPMALDYVPLIIFFGVYKYFSPAEPSVVATLSAVIKSTSAFMVAIVVAAIIAKWKLGRISPMTWLTAIFVIGFGGLTIYFNDQKFIQLKPTIIYVLLGGLLIGGLVRGKSLIKYVVGHAFPGLDDRGWMLLSRNWALFFFTLAGMNEVLWRLASFDTWLTVKVWGVPILSMLFVMANMPMLLKHGLGGEEETA